MTGRPPVLTIPVPGAPETCPNCGLAHVKWPLAVYGGRVYLTCPGCHVNVAQLAADTPAPVEDTAGCTCCDIYDNGDVNRDDECPRCGHLYKSHFH